MLTNKMTDIMKKVPIDRITLGIGDVARATGVAQSKLRYWENKGYIKSHSVTDNRNRKFTYKTLLQVQLIKSYLDDGYTLTSAVKRARQRGVYLDALRSFFEDRFVSIEVTDQAAMIDLGTFDPEPTKHLVAKREATGWRFALVDAES
ncbi:MerR family transcriptional regulator [Levilactobacillus zymae]|uniref:MerR family transcriptional regulator n=2 Tax=Levilactobacillus zymae TaxID=267363 RepID=A0A1Y6JXX6_9LACO|nr:MerR family transcriptional regulator [Levilactobacillus zymae]KRL10539.1 transcriptional regulator [Levilactobacillus zymae DSM 19395]GEO71341.1 MerR family transcriptional regulator [Levilactobacillus zymae]SMS14768.1 transcriptional regulator, MerR family [Levilactobacillus zymae]